MKDININYALKGKKVVHKLECKSEVSELICSALNLAGMIKD
jgi:hypothetical protein